MRLDPASIEWLTGLLEQGSRPASSCSKTVRRDVKVLTDNGLIARVRRGAGWRFEAPDPGALQDLVDRAGPVEPSLPAKARAVASYGDAHRGRTKEMVLMIGANTPARWSGEGREVEVLDIVHRCGIASLLVQADAAWQTDAPVALVENLDFIVHAPRYLAAVHFQGSAIFYAGKLSNQLLTWLDERLQAPSIAVFPDYDPVGLDSYLRARAVLGDRLAPLYVPPDLETLARRYGRDTGLETHAYRGLLADPDRATPEVIAAYQALLRAGKTLHQEGLLLSTDPA